MTVSLDVSHGEPAINIHGLKKPIKFGSPVKVSDKSWYQDAIIETRYGLLTLTIYFDSEFYKKFKGVQQ